MNNKSIPELETMDYSELSDDDLLVVFDVKSDDQGEREQAILRACSSTKSVRIGDLRKFLAK